MKNRQFVTLFALVIFSLTACLKDNSCDNKSAQSEAAGIQAYASANSINATADANGIYYEIITAGNPAIKPTVNSRIYITYIGKLLDGTVFDQQLDHTQTGWILGSLIPGWQLALPLIGEGGVIKMIIPSTYAYGCGGNGPIPANAVLFFEIQLVDVQ